MSTPRFQLFPGGRTRPSGGGVGWRLLGANNRELGRSAQSFVDAEAAHGAIAALPALLAQAPRHVRHSSATASWTWWIEGPDGEPAAVSGRGFRHERECRYNLTQFCDVAPLASTMSAAIPVQPNWWHPAEPEPVEGATP